MRDVLAMIMAGGMGERLYPLTRDRAKPAVPFGGIYRLIDFTLSNCINSGVRKIAVLTQYKSLSLEQHLRLGWSIFDSELDEYIFPIPPQMRINGDWYKGTADSIYQNLYFADTVNPGYFLILSADHIYKMDYSRMLAFHKEKGADATVATIEVDQQVSSQFGIMKVNDEGRVIGFEEKPKKLGLLSPNSNTLSANMGVYIFNSEILREFLEEDACKKSHHDFGKDIIPAMIHRAKVFAYNFRDENKKESKYWRDVGTIDAYFDANMELVAPDPKFNLYDTDWPIRTYQGQYPPAKTVFAQEYPGGRMGACLDSIVSGGCIISGGRVQDSVLSPLVRVNSYADIRESVLMEGVEVGRYCKIRRAIIDKGVKVPPGTEIGYDMGDDKKRFFVSDGGVVVIARGAKLSFTKREPIRIQKVIDYAHPQGVANWS
ncbi:MAG: glucose-1-phosphate adenylyltransferase [Deltaproteobacteria bacterium]|jgi:glucose-1-phosphate adenylyltransferase|nr:MAG: glucose-1-phosphate adenylyltransferase [Deltaproteobacteria bacterium]